MALVPNPGDADFRIYGPKIKSVYPLPDEDSKSRSYLLRKIGSFYRKARGRISTSSRHKNYSVRVHGLCVGFLDPVSNIMINSISDSCEGERKRQREIVLPEDLHRRSLDGLVVFLTRFFPNLAEGLAVRYLRVAKADALIAACIIMSDHGIKGFDDSEAEPALISMALKCAGLAAKHPDPKRLVYAWQKISNRIDNVLSLLKIIHESSQSPHRVRDVISQLAFMLTEEQPIPEVALRHAWKLAEASVRRRPRSLPQLHTHLRSRTLQDTIHGYYLNALARLPAGPCFHRSLIKAGHCYGPLDPVSNIIINTIWYHAKFPPSMKLELNVIGTRSLHRVANRSLYGLVSFLCTRYHDFDFHQAVCCLLQADANLVLADRNLDPASPLSYVQAQDTPDTRLKKAYLAAATAACHPNPDGQVKLLTSCKAVLGSALSLLHPDSHKLSTQDVQWLARLLSPESPYGYDSEMALPPLRHLSYPLVDLADLYTVVSKGVNVLLNKYQQMPDGDPSYELHTICGVNDWVGGPVQWPPHDPGRCHVNFLATPKSPCGGNPTLFFAEIQGDGTYDSFCCPVAPPPPCAAQIQCVYCEAMGTRIVHPVAIDFRGRDSEFEMLACEKDPCEREDAILRIINHRHLMAENVHRKEKEDFIYDGVDGHKNKFDDVSSLSVEEAMLLIPLCRYL